MKATLTYEGKTVEVEISETEAQKIFNEPKKTGWERVKPKEFYFSICSDGQVSADEDEGDDIDKHWYTTGNYFSDEQLANDQARAISLWLRIKRWSAEHCRPMAWGNNVKKYFIYYNIATDKVGVDSTKIVQGAFQVYFDTQENACKCIEEFKDELLWYFTECKDRMDG